MMTDSFLVSFPRTGSRWLRFAMEVFIAGRALHELTNRYYYDYHVIRHTHDFNITEVHDDIIYLYRNPIDTVYSLMEYENMNTSDSELIIGTTKKYATHATKWMLDDTIKKRTIVAYEDLQGDWNNEFKKICEHIGVVFDENKFRNFENLTKENLKPRLKFLNNDKLINTSEEYTKKRVEFVTANREKIKDAFLEVNSGLSKYFNRYFEQDKI